MPTQTQAGTPAFYTVFYRQYDGSPEKSTLLSTVRREYFSGRRTVRGSGRGLESGLEIRVRYRIGKNCFLWRKTCGKTVLQESFRRPGGGYALVTHNVAGQLVSRTDYGRDLGWIRTAYYGGGAEGPEALLLPGENGVVLLKYDPVRRKYVRSDLVFCPLYEGTARQSLVNDAAGEPEVCVRTDAGDFCCCTEHENRVRRAVLDGLDAECGTLKPVWPQEKEEVPVDFQVIPNDGSAPEKEESPEEPAAEPGSADYAADHELFSIEPEKPQSDPSAPAGEPASAKPAPAKYAVAAKGLKGGVVCAPGVPSARKSRGEREPFEDRMIPAKRIVVSSSESYLYFGEIMDGLRQGRGRTQMPGGATAYEGGYRDDMRDGFGVYYYRSGKLCYAGNWRRNLRNGAGVAFGAGDGSIFVGKWKDNIPTGDGTAFDMDGSLIYTGGWKDGKRHGRGTEYRDGRIVKAGEWSEDRFCSGYTYLGGKPEKAGDPEP